MSLKEERIIRKLQKLGLTEKDASIFIKLTEGICRNLIHKTIQDYENKTKNN